MPGFHWIIPVIDQMYKINVTEIMIDAQPQEIITNDNLNASVDAQVYFKIKEDEDLSLEHISDVDIPTDKPGLLGWLNSNVGQAI